MQKLTSVMYHYVRDLKSSRYPDIKGLDLELFIEQIKYLMRHYKIVRMEDVIDSIYSKKSLPEKAAILTFDDGYIDHYTNVFPILKKLKIQGSFFASSQAIIESKVLDVHKIHFILASAKDINNLILELRVSLDEYRDEFSLQSFDYYYDKLAKASIMDTKDVIFIKRLLQVELPLGAREKITKELFERYIDMPEESFGKELYMNQSQIELMVDAGMHFGSHGYRHYWWNDLRDDVLEAEVRKSMHFLSKIGMDGDLLTAAYPYGSYSEKAISVLKKNNFKIAFIASIKDVSELQMSSDRIFTSPRIDTNFIPKNSNEKPNKWHEFA